ncbi:class E sortase [Streptomyces sp. NPDC029526]|uniref:class E sortase n=1 Tax=Streptomyces sp. NPDC029526 TaxID=3155728 RepID=UPI0033C91A39
MTALRPERESGAEYGESFTDGSSYGSGGGQGSPYGQEPYGAHGVVGDGGWYGDVPRNVHGGTSYGEGTYTGPAAQHNGSTPPYNASAPQPGDAYSGGAYRDMYGGGDAYGDAYQGQQAPGGAPQGAGALGHGAYGQAPPDATAAYAPSPSPGATPYGGAPHDAAHQDRAAYDAASYGSAAYDGLSHDGPSSDGASYNGASYNGASHNGATAYGRAAFTGAPAGAPAYAEASRGRTAHGGAPADGPAAETAYLPPADDETVALRVLDPPAPRVREEASKAAEPAEPGGEEGGGRAARRKAAKRGQGRRGGPPGDGETPAEDSRGSGGRQAPLSRVEARRRAKANRPGPAVVASRAIGEVFITFGVLMLLFVTYQLWWTNVQAQAQAGKEVSDLQSDWANGKRSPGAFEPGQGFALLHMPKLDVVVPIAEGINSKKVLDRGMVGHYAEGALKTAMPEDKTGNFGLAGHRNTHGEPFRYINRLESGDPIVVETQDTYFVYEMKSILPVTSPSNISVLEPVPKGSGFTEPGRYITLTTCTPEFTSKYRMIVWGKMAEERPRSKGKPDALVN